MLTLEELEFRILAELEESGEGDVQTVMNVVLLGEHSSVDLNLYLGALRSLTTRDHIRLSTSLGPDKRLADLSIQESLREIDAQQSRLSYDQIQKYWIDTSRTGPPYGLNFPYVVLTAKGRAQSVAVLTERGYQWWSPVA